MFDTASNTGLRAFADDLKNIMLCRGQLSERDAEIQANAVLAAYAHPDRHFHDFVHLVEIYQIAEELGLEFEGEDAVKAAMIFKSVYCEPSRLADDYKGPSNKQSGAELAFFTLKVAGHSDDFAGRVGQLILFTERHNFPEADTDAALFADLEMAIWGQDSVRYTEYAVGLAKEFMTVFDAQEYKTARMAVLSGLLRQNRLFHTDVFDQAFGTQAHTNLIHELANIDNVIGLGRTYPTIPSMYAIVTPQ